MGANDPLLAHSRSIGLLLAQAVSGPWPVLRKLNLDSQLARMPSFHLIGASSIPKGRISKNR